MHLGHLCVLSLDSHRKRDLEVLLTNRAIISHNCRVEQKITHSMIYGL